MRKTDKRTENVMLDRMNWLKNWAKSRDYDISKQKRFLYFYFCTIRIAYGEEWAETMMKNMNERLSVPLGEDQLEEILKEADKKAGYKISNQKIIDDLGITEQEVIDLRIGHCMLEREQREDRAFEKFVRYMDVLKRYENGERIRDIAATTKGCTMRTIERWIDEAGLNKKRKKERDEEIINLSCFNKSVSEIAEIVGLDPRTVADVLQKQKPTNLLVEETIKVKKELDNYKDAGCSSFYTLYKSESRIATVDSYTDVLKILQSSKDNILLCGTAGTAKSSLINEFMNSLSTKEKAVTTVVAPTGVAAEHINGTTIHKAFELKVGIQEPEEIISVPKRLLKLRRLIIDEISMVTPDLFDKIISIIRFIEKSTNSKVQIIVCGDWGQLEPPVSKDDKKILKQYYPKCKSYYAFHSHFWNELNFRKVKLTYIFRQDNEEFRDMLMQIKYGNINALEWFNQFVYKNYDPKAIYLCSRNEDVDRYNNNMLNRMWREALIKCKAIENNINAVDRLPCPRVLELGSGVRVMTICNDKEYKNGSLGTVHSVNKTYIEVELDNGKMVKVKRKMFHLDSGGTYKQFPLVYGFAISVHKSQGCTFDSAIIVPGQSGFFAAGMLYVALSRVRDPQKLCLMKKLTEKDLIIDYEALQMTA